VFRSYSQSPSPATSVEMSPDFRRSVQRTCSAFSLSRIKIISALADSMFRLSLAATFVLRLFTKSLPQALPGKGQKHLSHHHGGSGGPGNPKIAVAPFLAMIVGFARADGNSVDQQLRAFNGLKNFQGQISGPTELPLRSTRCLQSRGL